MLAEIIAAISAKCSEVFLMPEIRNSSKHDSSQGTSCSDKDFGYITTLEILRHNSGLSIETFSP